VRNGRFPPQVVLEIARQLAAELARLETAGVTHGDACAAGLVLGPEGAARLPMPGIRAIVRPEEGYTFADLQPEAYDYLAPERVADGTPPNRAADLYACGCLWWQLLTGRPPLGGGDALSKLKAARGAKIADARRLAPETPDPLAAAIASCTRRDPARRPESMAQLAATLGPSTRAGREALAECLIRRAPRQSALVATAELMRRSRHTPVVASAAAGSLLMLAAITWPMWRGAAVPASIQGGALVETTIPSSSRRATPLRTRPPQVVDLRLNKVFDQAKPHDESRPGANLVLPSDRMTRAEELRFHPGQVVRPAGDRARVLVSQALRVTVEGVRFERIDFVAAMPDSMRPVEESRAMVELAAQGAEFVGCTFQPLNEREGSWAAASWSGAAAENSAPARLNFVDCVFRGVRIGVDCRLDGALLVDFKNTLHLGAGPLCRLRRLPAVDQAMLFRLRRCTLRGAASLLDLPSREVEGEPGEISIEATACVLAPEGEKHAALIRLAGAARPEPILQALDWSGQGSVLAAGTQFVAWYDADGRRHAIDDRLVTIDGLVRTGFEFAAPTATTAAACEIVRWSAPLRSDEPPGVRAASLVLPRF
jgi:hypothetical protein